jgi:hypothetical protein
VGVRVWACARGCGWQEAEELDDLKGQRVHAWVLVLAGKRMLEESVFLEPTTGIAYAVEQSPYYGIESLWSAANYWVNMQKDKPPAAMSYDLQNLQKWERGDPAARRGRGQAVRKPARAACPARHPGRAGHLQDRARVTAVQQPGRAHQGVPGVRAGHRRVHRYADLRLEPRTTRLNPNLLLTPRSGCVTAPLLENKAQYLNNQEVLKKKVAERMEDEDFDARFKARPLHMHPLPWPAQ